MTYKRVAMFGAGGFIGSNLAYHLTQAGGYDLALLDLTDDKLRIRFGDTPFNFVHCNILRDADIIDDFVSNSDIVLDLAAYVHPSSARHVERDSLLCEAQSAADALLDFGGVWQNWRQHGSVSRR